MGTEGAVVLGVPDIESRNEHEVASVNCEALHVRVQHERWPWSVQIPQSQPQVSLAMFKELAERSPRMTVADRRRGFDRVAPIEAEQRFEALRFGENVARDLGKFESEWTAKNWMEADESRAGLRGNLENDLVGDVLHAVQNVGSAQEFNEISDVEVDAHCVPFSCGFLISFQ
jgi:hypothetical protein